MTDPEIIALYWDREETAISATQSIYGSYCAAVARNILENPDDVEEVLNDTWLRVWNTIPPERPASLKLYLARIARNLSFDRFRTQTREKRGGGELPLALHELSECIPSRQRPEDALAEKELRDAINRFLHTLSRRDRRVFLLRYFYAESMDTIAVRCGIRPTLVRTILSRTRKKLKIFLVKEDQL